MHDRRADLRCALPGYPESRWRKTAPEWQRHLGALKILPTDDPYPKESHEDGCPGAWYRCPFILSLHKYERLQTDAGFSENLLLTSRSDDRLLLEAIAYYERERMRARARDQEVLHAKT